MIALIVRPRQAGKTTALVMWWKQDQANRVMLVSTLDEAKWIHRNHYSQVDWNWFRTNAIVLPFEARERLTGRRELEVGIDNLELVLWQLLGHNVSIATAEGHYG